MPKKFIILVTFTVMLMLLLPFICSRGWKASLKSYMQSELPGNVVFSGTDEEYSDVMIKVYISERGIVEEIPLFDYLCGVLCAEMPAGYELEALKAQAVAACSYMVYRMEGELNKPGLIAEHHGAYICTDPAHCKGYLSEQEVISAWGEEAYNKYYPKIEAAVNSVLGQIITYDGVPANTVWHSISSGQTENAADVWGLDVPYLVSVESFEDVSAPDYQSSISFDAIDFVDILSGITDQELDTSLAVGEIKRSSAGGVNSIVLLGCEFPGTQIRSAFKLRSTNFDLIFESGTFTFTVRGYGHGVGMSQYGANELAKDGLNYEQILKTYYTGVEITKYEFNS